MMKLFGLMPLVAGVAALAVVLVRGGIGGSHTATPERQAAPDPAESAKLDRVPIVREAVATVEAEPVDASVDPEEGRIMQTLGQAFTKFAREKRYAYRYSMRIEQNGETVSLASAHGRMDAEGLSTATITLQSTQGSETVETVTRGTDMIVRSGGSLDWEAWSNPGLPQSEVAGFSDELPAFLSSLELDGAARDAGEEVVDGCSTRAIEIRSEGGNGTRCDIDADGRLRRIAMERWMADGMKMTFEVNMSEFGVSGIEPALTSGARELLGLKN